MSPKNTLNNISTSELARMLGAYVPVTLVRQALTDGLPAPGETHSLNAATLFADMSGFTAMSEELASDGPRGAEELNRVLLVTFTAMIDVIHEMGGAVSHFYGDAMSVYFPDEDGQAALRALSCARQMQQLMLTSFGRVVTNRPSSKSPFFDLTIKIGMGYGSCQVLVIGDPNRSMEFVLAGTAVDEAAEAEKAAKSGDVIASQTILQQAGFATSANFTRFDEPLPQIAARPILNWSDYDEDALSLMIKAIAPFVPEALHSRLTQTGSAEMAEHRPVTSLFVQFSFVGDDDASSAIETAEMGRQLQAYYDWANKIVDRYGVENARVNRVLTGDKGNQLHIMFGAPIAPDAPDQALRCALALLREKPGYIASQKIGLAVGKVFAGPVGSESRREYTVVGDVVNLSARLMQVCVLNAVWTNGITANRTRQWIEFEQLPDVQLKGKQMAVTPFQATTERLATSQMQAYLDRWQRPLFGRDEELANMLAEMDKALLNEGHVVALSGPTGVGKSRMLGYATRYWLDNGGIGLIGVCQQHTTDIPFSPWRGIWRDFFGLTSSMSVEQQIDLLATRLNELLPGNELDFPLWADPLGLPIPQTDAIDMLTAEARQARFFTLVRRCFQAAAKQQPLLLIAEGLHWADQSSLALLDEITAHIENSALFVAITFRSEDHIQLATLARPFCQTIPVTDLSALHARQLLKHLVGADELPQAVEQQLGLRDREGRDSLVNPLFLEEALNVMTSAGVLRVNGRIQVDEQKLAQMQVPDTIHGLLLARLDRLPPATRDLLQVASVIGRQFEVDSLSALSQRMPRQFMLDLLNDLTTSDMTRLVTADPEWIYLFQHAMTHEVAYESLPFARRQELHALVADWIQERNRDNLRPYHPILAFHYSRAGIHEDGLHFSLQAAEDARAIFANKEAVELYNLAEEHLRALGIDERWETAVDLLTSRAEALRFLGAFSEAVIDVELANDLLDDKFYASVIYKKPKVLNLLAELKTRQAQFSEAEEITSQVIQMLDSEGPSDELARAYQWSGFISSSLGDYDKALKKLQLAETLCVQTNNNERLSHVLGIIAFVHYSQKTLEQALVAMQRSVNLSRNFSIPANIASSLSNISLVQFQLGKANEALVSIEEAILVLGDSSRNFLARASGNKAEILAYLGRMIEAEASFEEAIELFTAMDDVDGLLEVYLVMGYEFFASLQDWEKANDCFEKAEKIIEDTKNSSHLEKNARLLIGKSFVQIENNEYLSALDLLKEASLLIDENEFVWWRPVVGYYLGLVFKKLEQNEKAREYFLTSINEIKREGCPDYLPLLQLELALLETTNQLKIDLLRDCLHSAGARARQVDRIRCYKFVGDIFSKLEDQELQTIGLIYKDKSDALLEQTLRKYYQSNTN
ncbi:MAG: hypothetical protein DWQ04_03590 [Chloroflexi bacterium]|nr:MAG: hypothetical protein DWQ04_03590 [Chloroflexota bacterium]